MSRCHQCGAELLEDAAFCLRCGAKVPISKPHLRLKDLEEMDCDFLTAKQVAQVTGSGEACIRFQAHEDPDALGYPVCVQGRKVKIPREGFIFWVKYGRPVIVTKSES